MMIHPQLNCAINVESTINYSIKFQIELANNCEKGKRGNVTEKKCEAVRVNKFRAHIISCVKPLHQSP